MNARARLRICWPNTAARSNSDEIASDSDKRNLCLFRYKVEHEISAKAHFSSH